MTSALGTSSAAAISVSSKYIINTLYKIGDRIALDEFYYLKDDGSPRQVFRYETIRKIYSDGKNVYYVTDKSKYLASEIVTAPTVSQPYYTKFKVADILYDNESNDLIFVKLIILVMSIPPTFIYVDNLNFYHNEADLELT